MRFPASRYGAPNTLDRMKFIALVLMTIDHLGMFIFTHMDYLRAIGRLSMPLWLFVVGYHVASAKAGNYAVYLRKWRTYLPYIVLLAVLDYACSEPIFPFSILVTIMAAQAMLLHPRLRNMADRRPVEIFLVLLLFLLPSMFVVEYGSQGLMFALIGYWVRRKHSDTATRLVALLTLLVYVGLQNLVFGYNILWQIIVLLGVAYALATMLTFEQREWHFANKYKWFGFGACLVARYSLYYYVLHYAMLELVATRFYPPDSGHFQLFLF